MTTQAPLSPAEEDRLREHSKKLSVYDACGWSVMDGFGLRYITPFALALGANNRQIGVLNSLPALLGNISMLVTLRAMRKWPRKAISIAGVAVQSAFWLLLIGLGLFAYLGWGRAAAWPWAAIAIYTLLILAGGFAGPAWMSWMKDIVTKNIGAYFGRRNRIAGTVGMSGMIIAGFLLDRFAGHRVFLGFALIFFVAFLGRAVCLRFLQLQYEPHLKHDQAAHFTFFEFLKRMTGNNFGRFVIYISLYSMASNVAGPFTGVYMLRDLKFSYSQYMAVMLSSAVITLLLLPSWGRFADRHGNLQVLRITGVLVPIIPFLWLLSFLLADQPKWAQTAYLVAVQALAGLVWAGFELASGNFIYDAVSRQRMAICVSYFNILNGAGVLVGAVLGGLISSMDFKFLGLSSILWVFALSGLLRFLVYLVMNARVREVRSVEAFSLRLYTRAALPNISLSKFFEIFKPSFLRRPDGGA